MSDSKDCPSSDELRALSDGTLDDATRRRLTSHLEKCERCRAALANQSLLDELAFVDADPLLGLTAWSGNTGDPGSTETQRNDPEEEEPLEKSALPPEIDMQTCRLGKYEILGVIGHGGMGIVLRGFDSSLHRPVAIKVLNKHLASSPTARRRFQREARAAAAISHPHVVTIHAVEEQNGLPYLIMEFIDGGSLEERIRAQKHFTVKEVLRLGSQIAAGLAAAHAQGVIHRDIKPSNIMWEDSIGRVKITDFGLARVTMDNSELTSGGRAVGTPSYMAPEQVRGQTVDPRADLFSLGCLLYAMVAGRSPFRASHSFESARKVIDYMPRPLTEVDPRVPKFLSDIVARLLEKEPAARYQTAGEVADILTRHLAAANQAQSDQLDTTLAGFAAVPAKRRRWLPRAAAAAGLLVLVGVGLPYVLPHFTWLSGNRVPAGIAQLPEQQMPRTLLVSQVPGQGLTTIGAALAEANPGDTIRVLDGAEYREALQIEGARHRGLRLEAPQAARLVAPDLRKSSLDIASAENVTISGLRIAAPAEGHAVFIHGPCRGVVLENVECRHDSAAGAAATVQIYVTGEAASAAPLTIRNSRIASLGRGQCVWVSGSAETAPRIELQGNRFECAGSHVVFQTAARQIDIRGNAFVGGTNGVNLDLREELPDEQVCIANNTFLNTKYWIGLLAARTEKPIGTICNNLVLGSERVQGSLDDWQQVAAAWSIHHNLWEVDAEQLGEYRSIAEKLADLSSAVELVSRDSSASGFLQPPPDSLLLRGGAGTDWPAHIGAFIAKEDSEPKGN